MPRRITLRPAGARPPRHVRPRAVARAVVLVLVCLIAQGCRDDTDDTRWYRGNTHAHTVICGHADSPPEVVAQWYHDHGYHFVILSEHDHFIDPDSVRMPAEARDDFILIPGEEISGPALVHSTAMNVRRLVPQPFELEVTSEIIQAHVDGTLKAGGHAILNHPNYHYTVTAPDVLPVTRLHLFELYNGHPQVNNFGDEDHPGTEELWDELLTRGMVIFGVSSDDAHHFGRIGSKFSNPGRGWVMVRASTLTADAVTEAMNRGRFYASNGVILGEYVASADRYHVVVDQEKTWEEVASPELRGKLVSDGEEGFFIELIGPGGEVLAAAESTAATFAVDVSQAYVRVKVTLRREHPERGMEEFYAWGQPVFTDGRRGRD